MAVVNVGLAMTAQLESLVPPDWRILGEAEGLPQLPLLNIMLIRNTNKPSPITECLAEHIVEGFKP